MNFNVKSKVYQCMHRKNKNFLVLKFLLTTPIAKDNVQAI